MITVIPPEHRRLLAALRPEQIVNRPKIEKPVESSRKRPDRASQWAPVGAILEGQYLGETFRAEVIESRKYKSGKALCLLTPPVKGTICRSYSGAQEVLTLAHRQKMGIKGKTGLPAAWSWFRIAQK